MSSNKIPFEFKPDMRSPAYLLRTKLLKSISKYSSELNGKMMDFGCGSKPYKSLFSVKEYIGVDFNGEGHSHENEQIDQFYDGHTLPFPEAYFDSVFSSEVFEHVFNLEDIMKEIYRVLKPGGKILVTCPFAIAEHEAPNDYARYTSFGLKHLFEKNNFKVVSYEKIGNHFETIMQLRIIYFYFAILGKFNKVPLVKKALALFIIPIMNFYAKIGGRILPNRTDLYMNNLILCEKK